MFAGQSRDELRRMYLATWRKFRGGEPLEPLERQVAAVIAEHPEYHAWLEAGDAALSAEFTPEGGQMNPFLHLGLHLAIREQVATDRPAGIKELHAALSVRRGSEHDAEHAMLEVLGEVLWQAQRSGRMPDEHAYLDRLLRLP
jgi:hypothetical protein